MNACKRLALCAVHHASQHGLRWPQSKSISLAQWDEEHREKAWVSDAFNSPAILSLFQQIGLFFTGT